MFTRGQVVFIAFYDHFADKPIYHSGIVVEPGVEKTKIKVHFNQPGNIIEYPNEFIHLLVDEAGDLEKFVSLKGRFYATNFSKGEGFAYYFEARRVLNGWIKFSIFSYSAKDVHRFMKRVYVTTYRFHDQDFNEKNPLDYERQY